MVSPTASIASSGRAMGAAHRLGHDVVDHAEPLEIGCAVSFIASAASWALALRHRIEAQPSGEITE